MCYTRHKNDKNIIYDDLKNDEETNGASQSTIAPTHTYCSSISTPSSPARRRLSNPLPRSAPPTRNNSPRRNVKIACDFPFAGRSQTHDEIDAERYEAMDSFDVNASQLTTAAEGKSAGAKVYAGKELSTDNDSVFDGDITDAETDVNFSTSRVANNINRRRLKATQDRRRLNQRLGFV